MKEKWSFFTIGLLSGILAAALAMAVFERRADSSVSGGRVLKLAHNLESSHPVHAGMEFMKKRIEELSGGRLRIDIYSGGALGSETKCIEQLQNGSLDMAKASSAQLGMFVPQFQTLALPYLFRDHGHYWRVLDSKVGDKFLSFARAKNMYGLCFYDAGSRSFYTTKKPIRTPGDLAGMKIRVMNSRTDMETIDALGASPTPISSGETYTSMAQGVVDGAENNIPTYYLSGHCEVAKYFTEDEHSSIPDVLVMSQKTWDSLSQEDRQIIMKAARESSKFQRQLWEKFVSEAREALAKKGVEFIVPDKSVFAEKIRKVYDSRKGTESGALVDEIRAVK